MKAIILAAGKGTRLDGAAVKPKCLVDVGGSTLLHRQIETLRSLNVTKIVVVVGFEQTAFAKSVTTRSTLSRMRSLRRPAVCIRSGSRANI